MKFFEFFTRCYEGKDTLREIRTVLLYCVCRDSSVGIATGYGLDGPGIKSRCGWVFPHLSRPALGPTQPPVNGYRVFLGVKSGQDVTLTPHPFLVPWSWKGRPILLLPLWAVWIVQSLSACAGVNFTLPQCLYKGDLYLTSVPVQGCNLRLFHLLCWRINTLRTGLLNCLNARSRGLNFRHRASCI